MNAAPVYDLILQGGHVICPASGIDGVKIGRAHV